MITINTRICSLLEITVPILQAPMAGAVTPQLISEVANFGGFGTVPLSNWPLEKCEKILDRTLQLTKANIGVNLILEWDQRDRVALSLQKGIKTFWFCWGDPQAHIPMIHAHGGKVILTVSSADEARKALSSGVDIIVTQGWEAGGHIWGTVATMPLVPAVIDAVGGKIPVIAAGGIADGRGMAAALVLGAEGVVIGTRLLTSHESGVHEDYKNRIIAAQETDTVFTDIFDKGWPNAYMRVLQNSTYEQWLLAGMPPAGQRPGEHDVITELSPGNSIERYSRSLPSAGMNGDTEPLANYAGQSVGLVHQKQATKVILQEIVDEAAARIQACNRLISSKETANKDLS